jgi:hypothetical protein
MFAGPLKQTVVRVDRKPHSTRNNKHSSLIPKGVDYTKKAFTPLN